MNKSKLLVDGVKLEAKEEPSFEVEQIDQDLFKSKKLWGFSNTKGAFGGSIIAQAVHAAVKTVRAEFHLHSLHCYFIKTGDVNLPSGVIYQIDRLRDGNSYSTRSVKAIQQSKSIFTLILSFHIIEVDQPILIPKHSIDLSHIPDPDHCPSRTQVLIDQLSNRNHKLLGFKNRQFRLAELQNDLDARVDCRLIDLDQLNQSNSISLHPNSRWFRFQSNQTYESYYNKLILAYASDLSFIGSVSQALKLDEPTSEHKLSMLVSLDHSMFFYDHEFDVCDWMLYQMEAEASRFGRGLVIGRIYDRRGHLIAICTQEGVVRTQKLINQQSKL